MGKITAHGAVPVEIGGKEFANLTGSAYIYEINGKRILVDLGMFQGCEGSDLFNKENRDFLKGIDIVLITHPHIDHIGRLPLLNQMGFEGEIYMSSACKEITYEMLVDSFKIQNEEIQENLRKNKHLGKRLRLALKIKNYIGDLENNKKLTPEERNERKTFLGKKLGKEYNTNEVLEELEGYLELYSVKEESDIEKALEKLKKPMFSMEDIAEVLKRIKTVDIGEEKILYSKNKKVESNEENNNVKLRDLPKLVNEGFKENVSIESKRAKREIRKVWVEKLKENIQNVKNSGINLELERKKLKDEFEKRLKFLEQYKFLEDPEKKGINNTHYENTDAYKDIRRTIREYTKFLKKYGVTDNKSAERIIYDDEKLIDLLNINLDFTSKDIETASRLLEVKEVETTKEIIGLSAVDAAHVVGSVSYQIISGETKNKVKNLVNLGGSVESVYFSGDLGRMHDNRLGQPDIPKYPTDYLQIESTYGGKDHLEKEKAIEYLIEEIESTEGKVLISTFSQQRNQEILLTLLDYLKKKGAEAIDYEVLIDAPLAERLTNIYINHYGDTFNLLKPGIQEKIFGKTIFRYLGEGEYEEIYNDSQELNTLYNLKNFDVNNSKLKNISNEDKVLLTEKISILVEANLRGDLKKIINEIIKIMGIDLYQEFFGEIYYNNKKTIILASSGMIDGGAIMNHLPHILVDSSAKLLAPGYLSEGTLGNQIVMQKSKNITINGDKFRVKCQSKYLDGFSSHIGHTEILEYITKCIKENKLNKGAVISLTHGSRRGQYEIKKDLEEILEGFDRADVKVKIPNFGETYYVDEDKTIQKGNNYIYITEKKTKETPVFLLAGESKLTTKEEKEIRDETDEKLLELSMYSSSNQKEIDKLIEVLTEKLHEIRNISYTTALNIVDKKLKTSKSSYEKNIKNFSGNQRKELNENIDLKLSRNKEIENEISNFSKNAVGDLKKLIDDIYNFIYVQNKLFKEEFIKLTEKLNSLNEEKLTINQLLAEERIKSDNKDRINKLKKDLKATNGEIKKYEDGITYVNKVIQRFKTDSSRIIRKYNTTEDSIIILDILEQLWKNNELFDEFRNEIQKSISKINNKISLLEGELESHIIINFQREEPNFRGEDLFSILYPNNSEKIDLDGIKKYIQEGYILDQDILFIKRNIEIIETSKSKIDKQKAGRAIRKFFKEKSAQNNDLGVDYKLNIGKLEEFYLNQLKNLFEKEYFDSYIYPSFNIYLFIKSKSSFYNYIFEKFDYKKLRTYKEQYNNYKEYIDDLEYYENLLLMLNNKNDIDFVGETEKEEIEKKLEEVKELEYGIELTKKEVLDIIGNI